ncbi:hypothetical protein SAMN06265337_0252 [Hymenobacter gelipurpurascens]|uniref:Uncharacterized protein n=1 Tax=Hymenobacter gelipurpurascens TaxID=89968 RepID=A0A212T2Z1_9BACT|nr:hypothetical protein SAMN06265337_0252 [Hymenobacter gelipurpurascens]
MVVNTCGILKIDVDFNSLNSSRSIPERLLFTKRFLP